MRPTLLTQTNGGPIFGSAEMALHVLAYNLTRVMNINGRPTAHRGDEGIVTANMRLSVEELPRTAGPCQQRQQWEKPPHPKK